jgi:hypothetical protein
MVGFMTFGFNAMALDSVKPILHKVRSQTEKRHCLLYNTSWMPNGWYGFSRELKEINITKTIYKIKENN